jgi:hypothetical protein
VSHKEINSLCVLAFNSVVLRKNFNLSALFSTINSHLQ